MPRSANTLPSLTSLLSSEASKPLPTAKFPNIGDGIVAEVVSAEVGPQFNYETGRQVYRAGKPQVQVNVTLRDSVGDDFLLIIRVPSQLWDATKTALREAHRDNFEAGDFMSVRYVADQEVGEGLSPAKVYQVKFQSA